MGSLQRALRARSNCSNQSTASRASGLVLIMILSTLFGFTSPALGDTGTDDLGITSVISPIQGGHYDMSDQLYPKVTVRNDGFAQSDPRTIYLDICEGDTLGQDCPVGGFTQVSKQVPRLNGTSSTIVDFGTSVLFWPDNPGIHTIVIWIAGDIDPSDDRSVVTFYFDNPLRDLVVTGHSVDPTNVYNSNTPIESSLTVTGKSWLSTSNFTADWSMHVVDNPVVAEAQDCVDWESDYTGTFNQSGEVVIQNFTHLPSTSNYYFTPYAITATLGHNSEDVIADILIAGSQFDQAHSVEIVASIDGNERYTYWYNFTGDSMTHTETLYTDFGNGTICFTAKMYVSEVEVASASHILGGSAYSGSFADRSVPLPNITAPAPGTYEVRAGVSEAWLWDDANSHNNRVSFTLIVNDDVDVWIREVVPARGTTTYVQDNGQYLMRYPYGEDSVRVVAGNIGYMTTTSRVEINFLDISSGNLVAGPYDCELTLEPGEEDRCDFDFSSVGNFRLNVSITTINGDADIHESDNWLEQLITINYGTISPVIANPTANSLFDSGESILAVAGTDSMAPYPLNYTWRLNYLTILGYGEVTDIVLPMGEWTLTLFVCTADAITGECLDEDNDGVSDFYEIAAQPIRILNHVDFEQGPYLLSGTSISTYPMEENWDEPQLPPPNRLYPAAFNKGKEPLMMFNLSMSLIGNGDEFSIDSLEAWIDVDAMLPASINRSTIEILRIGDWESFTLEEFSTEGDSYLIAENGSAYISIGSDEGGGFMVIGTLPPIVVNPSNLSVILKKDGQVSVDWDNEGDITNPYFGGWQLYRKSQLLFTFPFSSDLQFEAATDGYYITDLAPLVDSWEDPNYWEQGICLSYLVVAKSRAGVTDWVHGNVSAGTWNNVTQRMDSVESCVDNQSPTTVVPSFNSIVTFDNVTKLHSVELSWTWPEVDEEGPLTWNLYRSEVDIQFVDYLEPIQVGLSGAPGLSMTYIQTEGLLKQDIHIEQSYVYILIPFDEVGNSDYAVRSANKESVTISDQYWEYHPAPPAPPPPPPPELPLVGESTWYGELLDEMETDRFQFAGILFMGILLMNFLLIPMIINKYRAKKRGVLREKAKQRRRQEMLDADEFADELEDFFD